MELEKIEYQLVTIAETTENDTVRTQALAALIEIEKVKALHNISDNLISAAAIAAG